MKSEGYAAKMAAMSPEQKKQLIKDHEQLQDEGRGADHGGRVLNFLSTLISGDLFYIFGAHCRSSFFVAQGYCVSVDYPQVLLSPSYPVRMPGPRVCRRVCNREHS
jgi:hypothetical protein